MSQPHTGPPLGDAHAVAVPLVRWPAEAERRAALADAGLPRLLVLAADEPPPTSWDDLEDWVRSPIDAEEVEHRRATLRRRHRRTDRGLVLDDDGLLHRGSGRITLSPLQAALVAPLVAELGRPVARATVTAAFEAAGGSADPQTFRTAIHRLRLRLAPLELELHLLSGRALMLELGESPSSPSGALAETMA